MMDGNRLLLCNTHTITRPAVPTRAATSTLRHPCRCLAPRAWAHSTCEASSSTQSRLWPLPVLVMITRQTSFASTLYNFSGAHSPCGNFGRQGVLYRQGTYRLGWHSTFFFVLFLNFLMTRGQRHSAGFVS